MYIAYDMSSFIWRGLLVGKDVENGKTVTFNDKEVIVNSAEYGYENVINMMLGVMHTYKLRPINAILVLEGTNSKSKRLLICNSYKETRDSRPPEAYTEFQRCKEMIVKAWLDIGSATAEQAYCEGDDALAWLAQETEEKLIIATYDNDLSAANIDRNKYGAEVEVWVNGLQGVNKYGNFPPHLITAYKALVGDSGDNIPGCKGFGPKAFETFVSTYGLDGLQEFYDLCKAGSLAPLQAIENDKMITKILEQQEGILTSFQLALLRPEWVNTLQHPIEVKRGIVALPPQNPDDRFVKYYGNVWLVTADNFVKAASFLKANLPLSPYVTLDIETSASDVSKEWSKAAGVVVDTFGSELTGLSLTFGSNNQYTFYFSVNHAKTNNLESKSLCELIGSIECEIVIQNVAFELVVLYNEWGEWLKDNGNNGYLRNILDTMLEASYVDENSKRGLKERSLSVLGYTQETYEHVTTITGQYVDMLPGGELVSEIANSEGVLIQTRQYRMCELEASHVLSYGGDDARCTAALHNHYKLMMQLEHQYETYIQVEIPAAYLHAHMFLTGVTISLEKMKALEADDAITFDRSWAILRQYLIENGWEGTIPPIYTKDITPAEIKSAFMIVTGRQLETMVRTVSKLVILIREVEKEPIFAGMLERCIAGEEQVFTSYVQSKFKGEPIFSDGSTVQMQGLLYKTMGLPIRIRNKLTDAMRSKGLREGSAKTDALAIAYALQDATEGQKAVLEALRLMSMVGTRRSLYYNKYPSFPHWKDGKVHSSHNQSTTNTRRASSSGPNLQQLPKNQKIEGQPARFREVIVPHHKDAVIVSCDFEAQELRQIADYSKDPNMVSCYIGDNPRDMHAMTGLGIFNRVNNCNWSYEEFMAVLHDPTHERYKEIKKVRALGKQCNFSTEFGAEAPKLAQILMVSEAEAQSYIDIKEATFNVASAWKQKTIREAKLSGFVSTKLGARRHLRDFFMGNDRWVASKAERQSVNFRIQSSSAEQTKLAEGRMWSTGIFYRYDARCYGPIHDEVVVSVAIKDLFEFIPEMHACMVAQYADMFIPIGSSISFGRSFGEQIEIGNTPSREAIEKGLKQMQSNV